MTTQRQIEIFSAGCPACQSAIDLVNDVACGSCEVTVYDMSQPETATRAASLGIRSVPAVVVNGRLLDCCRGGLDEQMLRDAGVGRPSA